MSPIAKFVISPIVRSVLRLAVTALKSLAILPGLVINPVERALFFIALIRVCWRSDRLKSLVECRLRAYLSAISPSKVWSHLCTINVV